MKSAHGLHPLKTLSLLMVSLIVLVAALLTISRPTSLFPKAASKRSLSPTETFTFHMVPGWNAISLPMDAKMTARRACQNQTGFVQIGRYINNDWLYYSCGQRNQADFVMQPNVGYFISTTETADWTLKGVSVEPQYTLALGWNFVGIPLAGEMQIMSQSLCGPFDQTNLQVLQVSRYVNGGWDTHDCSIPAVNNYQLEKGAAYFVNAVEQN